MIITSVAQQVPDRIAILVFLTAYISLNRSLCRLAVRDKQSRLKYSVELKGLRVGIVEDAAKELFYHDCSDEDVRRAKEYLRNEPIIPVLKKVKVTDNKFGSVEKIYIKALEDKAISPQIQEFMYGSVPFGQVFEIKTSHSPFYSKPEELCEILSSLCVG